MGVSRKTTYIPVLLTSLFLFFFSACTVVKNYPVGKPYVYQTNVHVSGQLGDEPRKELELQLADQLHDSIRIRSVAKLIGWDNAVAGFIPRFFYDVVNTPTAFDSLHADKSLQFMKALLNSLGYYRDSVNYTVKIDSLKEGKELRTAVDFYVYPGVVTRLDSIGYALNADTASHMLQQKQALDTLQKITIESLKESVIKKGDPFSKYKLSAERDRLANLYRDNGYLRFSEEEMLVLWDTVGIELLRPTLDPIEEVQLLQRRAERRLNPVSDVEFRLRANPDSTRAIRYYVGNVTVLPDFYADTTKQFLYTDTVQKLVLKYNLPLFKKKIFPDYIFLEPGALYRQSNYLKTQNKFNAITAWRLVSIVQSPRRGQDTADFEIRLTPSRKYAFTTNLEVSYNRGNITLAQGNLLGVGLSSTIQNRNFSRGANLGITNFRFGTELNATLNDFIQSRQVSLGHTIQFPRLIPKALKRFNRRKENTVATIFSLNSGFTDRKDYFALTSVNASWGYQSSWRNKTLGVRFPNIEYNYLVKRDSLDTLISRNASYQYIFNTGLIISMLANHTIAGGHGNITNLKTFSGELSGFPGFFKNTFATNLYRFLKFDFEFRQTHKLTRNAFAWRVFTGIGWGLPTSTNNLNNRYLPFFRSYFAGGPNSMRAWAVRKLGPGSSIRSFGRTDAPDRFGDLRLEGNAEYRIFLTNYKGISLNTALFTDIGNVWFLRKNPDFPDGEFAFAKLWKDLAIGAGTGLRADFGFLKIRFDYSYKVKDPTPQEAAAQNKFFYNWGLLRGQLQLGIDYPF